MDYQIENFGYYLSENHNKEIVEFMVKACNEFGIKGEWEAYSPNHHDYDSNTLLSKNVKNRGWPKSGMSDAEFWEVVSLAHDALDTDAQENIDAEIFVEGRMGGHWCLKNVDDCTMDLCLVLFDCHLTTEGCEYMEACDTNGDIPDYTIDQMIEAERATPAFIEFNDVWEQSISNLESL
jgi:hypothetical protein